VFMFLRDMFEQSTINPQLQRTYVCPMIKCSTPFAGSLELIQHLLDCPEVPNGVFECDKCSHWHEFPTNEKDWATWTGWKPQHVPVQRKRSLGSKIRDNFTLRRRESSRKLNPSADPQLQQHGYLLSRPGTSASGTQKGVAPEHQMTFTGNGTTMDFLGPQRSALGTGIPDVGRDMLWQPGFSVDEMSELHSAVSSIAASSTLDASPSQAPSTNTSQTTLFTTRFAPYQSSTPTTQANSSTMTPQPFIFSSQTAFESGTATIESHQHVHSSAMSLDEPLPVSEAALSPPQMRPETSNDNSSWWGMKTGLETQGLTPVSSVATTGFHMQTSSPGMLSANMAGDVSTPTSPCTSCSIGDRHSSPLHAVPQHPVHHTMSRTLSQESIQAGITGLYGLALSEGNQLETALSPTTSDHHHAQHHHHRQHHHHHNHNNISVHRKTAASPGAAAMESPEELVCDECQWKPRGVRENLKGYLRKHKNTHKGLRLSCDVVGCTKTFSRLDNLKKHKKDKHGIDETGSGIMGTLPLKRVAEESAEHIAEEKSADIVMNSNKRPDTSDSRVRGVSGDYSMLWPALHF